MNKRVISDSGFSDPSHSIIALTGKEFKRLRGPLVYTWRHDKAWLYVGRSFYGLARPFDYRHHKIKLDLVQDNDEIRIIVCPTTESAKRLETKLIRMHKPLYNSQDLTIHRSKTPKWADNFSTIGIRWPKDEVAQLRVLAANAGVSISDLIRNHIRETLLATKTSAAS